MRGTAPLLVALVSVATLGEHLSLMGWLGVAGVSVGVLVLGLPDKLLISTDHTDQAKLRNKAIRFALANAIIIAL